MRRNGRTRRNLAAVAVLSDARGLLRISALGIFTNHPVSEKPQYILLLPVFAQPQGISFRFSHGYADIIHANRNFVNSKFFRYNIRYNI